MMENRWICEICGKDITKNNSYIISHIKRKHNISIEDYIEKYYINLSPDFIQQKCGFCNNLSKYEIDINHDKKTYIKYHKKYFCGENECIEKISLDILGEKYNKKSFESIGSKKEYLSKLYKINIEDAKKLKYDENRIVEDYQKTNLEGFILRYGEELGKQKYKERCEKIGKSSKKEWYIEKYGEVEGNKKWQHKNRHKTNLEGFILKYGEELGKQKYKERCEKIGQTNTKNWYIEKYGEVEGNKKWNIYIDKIKRRNYNSRSTASKIIGNILDNLSIKYEIEYPINNLGKNCDYYLPEYNIIIEFYGDYWHCNPKLYEGNYYHQYIKKTANEIWKHDKQRLYDIKKELNSTIIVVWESTKINKDILYKYITDFNKKSNIIYL